MFIIYATMQSAKSAHQQAIPQKSTQNTASWLFLTSKINSYKIKTAQHELDNNILWELPPTSIQKSKKQVADTFLHTFIVPTINTW